MYLINSNLYNKLVLKDKRQNKFGKSQFYKNSLIAQNKKEIQGYPQDMIL